MIGIGRCSAEQNAGFDVRQLRLPAVSRVASLENTKDTRKYHFCLAGAKRSAPASPFDKFDIGMGDKIVTKFNLYLQNIYIFDIK